MGHEVIFSMSRSTTVVCVGVHTKGVSFFRRLFNGLARLANPGMKVRLYPSTPSVLRTSLMFFSHQTK